jgi:HEAT repeat protein
MKRITILLIAALGLVLTACGGGTNPADSKPQASGLKVEPKPPPIPTAPEVDPQPLNQALRDAARQELLADCNLGDPFLRCNAIEALSEGDPAEAPGPVLRGLHDPEPSVRFAAALAAGQLRLDAAYEPLLNMAGDPDPRVRAGVLFALHKLGDSRLTLDLQDLALNDDATVRATTAMVLGLLGEPSAIPILLRLNEDKKPAVRIQAAEALWRLGDERGLKDLAAYSISGYPDDQVIALQALAATHDERVIGNIEGQLTTDFTEVNLAAARALGMVGSDRGYKVAVAGADSKDPRQRSLAALAMGAIGRSDLQAHLKPMLADPEASVRISAALGILQLRAPSA